MLLNSKSNAEQVLREVCELRPTWRNRRHERDADIIAVMLVECGLPNPPKAAGRFHTYWQHLHPQHILRVYIPQDVAAMLQRVQAVFDEPEDWQLANSPRVTWQGAIERCRRKFII